jgi:hypothetical protein
VTSRNDRQPVSRPSEEWVRGRTATPWTDAHDWVGLAATVEPAAHSLYVRLKMHLNQKRGDTVCWPGKDSLAEMMGFAKAETLDRYIAQLEAVGAVDVEKRGVPARCYYRLNEVPADRYCLASAWPVAEDRCRPHGSADDPCTTGPYAGPLTLAEWYDLHAEQIKDRAGKAKTKRDRHRAKTNPQVNPETRPNGVQDESDIETARPVCPEPRSSGVLDTRWNGVLDTRSSGVEQRRSEQRRTEQPGGHVAPLAPLRPEDPPSSGLPNANVEQTVVDGDELPQGGQLEGLPRTREAAAPPPTTPVPNGRATRRNRPGNPPEPVLEPPEAVAGSPGGRTGPEPSGAVGGGAGSAAVSPATAGLQVRPDEPGHPGPAAGRCGAPGVGESPGEGRAAA